MGYSSNSRMVRVDFFRPSGKWYCTEAVEWTGEYFTNNIRGQSLIDAYKESLRNHFKDNPGRLSGMTAVCLEPYSENSFPIMVESWER